MLQTPEESNACSTRTANDDIGRLRDAHGDDEARGLRNLMVAADRWLQNTSMPITVDHADGAQRRAPVSVATGAWTRRAPL